MVSKVRGGHKRSRLVSELMSRRMEVNDENEDSAADRFYIRSHNEGFQNRQTSVFDKLNELESKFTVNATAWKSTEDDDTPVATDGKGSAATILTVATDKPSKLVTAGPCNKDEQFKIPIGVAPKRIARPASMGADPGSSSSVPAYCANPDQWTKYSLANITAEFMSEDANTDAAMTFLAASWKACSDYEDVNGEDSEPPNPPRKLEFGGFLMPEYTVGRSGKKAAALGGATGKTVKNASTDPDGDPVKLPKVKLSFLNMTTGDKNVSTSGSLKEPGCSLDDTEPATSGSPYEPPSDVEPVFRAIRKRKRNIRQASINNDDGDYSAGGGSLEN